MSREFLDFEYETSDCLSPYICERQDLGIAILAETAFFSVRLFLIIQEFLSM